MSKDLSDKIAEDIIAAAPDQESADWIKSRINSGHIIIMS
jgi:hypothetical protein